MKSMKQNTLLSNRLAALVDDYGYQKVRANLDSLKEKQFVPARREKRKNSADCSRDETKSKSRVRRDALAIVQSLNVADEGKKSILMNLAARFEAKEFMPNSNSVRAFLQDRGTEASHIKSRQQSASAVFRNLAEMGIEDLREIHDRGLYGPPKTLKGIADAIESFGRTRRAQSQ